MKILATVKDGGFIVEVGKYEMATLTGKEEHHSGQEVDLDPIYWAVSFLKDHKQQLLDYAKIIEGTANNLRKATQIFPEGMGRKAAKK